MGLPIKPDIEDQIEIIRSYLKSGKPFVVFSGCYVRWTKDGFPRVKGTRGETPCIAAINRTYLDGRNTDLSAWNMNGILDDGSYTARPSGTEDRKVG